MGQNSEATVDTEPNNPVAEDAEATKVPKEKAIPLPDDVVDV